MRKNRSFFWIISILFMVQLLPVFQMACKAEDKGKKTLVRVGIFPLEPLNFMDDNGKAKGFYPGLIKKIAARENWKIQFIQGSWATCFENLKTGKIDLLTTIAYTPERAKILSFSKEPVVDIWGQIFVKPGGNIQSFLDLKNQKIAIMKGGINGLNFISTVENFGIPCEIIEFDSHDDVFTAIQEKKVAAGVAPQHFGLRHAKRYNLVGTSVQFSPFSIYFATPKGKNTHLLDTIDSYLKVWKNEEDSVYYQQLNKWMTGTPDSQMIPKWLLFSLIIAAGVSILLFIFNRLLKIQVIKKTTELKDSENHYRELVESANTIILRWDADGKIIFINQFGLDLFNKSQQDVLGQNILDFISPVKQYTANNLVEMTNNITKAPERYALIETEHLFDENRKVFLQWSNKPILDDNGNLKEVLSVGTDISQRKHLENHLVEAQKMEAIGTLAGGIAHDFNNILTVIMGNAELAYANQNDVTKISENLDKLLGAAHRAKELTGQILAFSRGSDLEKSPLDLAQITKETINMVRSTLPSTIKINSDIDCDKVILANPTQLHQVILNLCTNAFHAMEETGGTLTVSIQEVTLNRDTLYLDGIKIKAGTYLILKISDTGPGIEADIISKIFEPYFTTKAQGKGTGMGLAVAHGIIRDHGGHIKVYSTPGHGAHVDVYLPVAGNLNIEKPKATKKEVVDGHERLMIVDDEKPIVDAISGIVTNYGYTPSKFTDSTAALKAFQEHPEQYDLIITDMTMPEMTGLQLTREIFKIRKDIPIIICTGYTDLITQERAFSLGASEYLQKPVLKKDLLTTIRKVLDKKTPP